MENVFLQLCFNDENRIEQQILINNRDEVKDTNIQDQNSSSTSIHLSINTISQNARPGNIQQKPLEKTRQFLLKKNLKN